MALPVYAFGQSLAAPGSGNLPPGSSGPKASAVEFSPEDGIAGYFDNWFARANEAQESQPRWMTPVVTVTPLLQEEVRYDQFWEHLPTGASLHNYDTGKGIELIPTTTNEIILGLPAYEERKLGHARAVTGWADESVLIKQRLFSENAQSGDAVITAFLQASAPTGSSAYTGHVWVITPTLAGGKGWGNFDVQATIGGALPIDHFHNTGAQLLTNVALQYHLLKYFWPEFEFNDTDWLTGTQRGGKNQLFLTPGLMVGRFVIYHRVGAAIGFGYQFAVSPTERTTGEILPVYDHNWILSARLTF